MTTAQGVNSNRAAVVTGAGERSPGRRALAGPLLPLLLTPLVLLIHGYHPFAGDAGLYVAGIRHLLDPSLYPVNAVFPAAFTRLSLVPWVLAEAVRLSHLPLAWVLLAAHLLSILLFLTACRHLATRLFATELAARCCVLLGAVCFTLPVAGTALFLMDPYVTARSFSTPLGLMAVAACVERAWMRCVLLLVLAILAHPLMGAYAVAFVILQALIAARRGRLAVALCCAALVFCGGVFLMGRGAPVAPAYREAVSLPAHTFLFLARWRWYEQLGLFLPLLLFAVAVRRLGPKGSARTLGVACLLMGITSTLIAALFVPAGGPCPLVPFQVLRSFHLIYAVGVVLCGGLLAGLWTRSRLAGISVVALLSGAMLAAQLFSWPGSSHVEWPGMRPANAWQQAFLWIRDNTPRNAVFAFNPRLVYLAEEDEQGFRAIAERDHLADDKDAGIVADLPRLADRWARQRNAQFSVDGMTDAQRVRALMPLGANWLLLSPGSTTQLPCPYRNRVVVVCRMAPAENDR